jgi:diaminohydroxyphosphoribosylaminopyrimidine deaminase/5-amino-6-(5-phosphoribosylamino)uracil reductase
VNLEPCSHFGKTPPCADLIIQNGIKRIVIGSKDPNPKVAGKGIQKLVDAGCEVIQGVLEPACEELNKRFFSYHSKKRPFIFLKWAQTNDGFVAPLSRDSQNPVWITAPYARQWVHKLRAQEQAILVGANTVVADNPSLTTRNWEGPSPVRIVLDPNLKIEKDNHIYDQEVKTIFITSHDAENQPQLIFEQIDFSQNVGLQICDVLVKHQLQSLIVEGGTQTLQTFIDEALWDEAYVFTGNTSFTKGIEAPKLTGNLLSEEYIGSDKLSHYKNNSH